MALVCATVRTAIAGNLEFSPVLVTLTSGQRATTLEIVNHGGDATAVQIRSFAWSQAGDEDRLEPTAELIASPPITTVPAGETQTVRLILRGGDGSTERFYRLRISELPAPTKPGQVAVLIDASLPVFVISAQRGGPQLTWRAERKGDGQINLVATNTGHRYARIGEIKIRLPNGAKLAAKPLGRMPYVLPGAERRWRLETHIPPPPGTIIDLITDAQIDKADATVSIP